MSLRSALLPCFAAFALAVGACEKSAPAEEEPPPPPPAVMTSADVVGRWIIPGNEIRNAAYNWIKGQVEDRDLPVDGKEIERHVDEVADYFRDTPASYTFEEDGTFHAEAGEFSRTGKWTLKNNVVTVKGEELDHDMRFSVEPGIIRTIPYTSWGRVISMIKG